MANIQNVDQESVQYANHKARGNGFYLPQTAICISKNKSAFLKDVVTMASRNKPRETLQRSCFDASQSKIQNQRVGMGRLMTKFRSSESVNQSSETRPKVN